VSELREAPEDGAARLGADARMTCDVLVIGAGAAGLAAAIAVAQRAPHLRVRCVDGARHLGAKILVSGGSRCNVTNRLVDERDFWGGSSRAVRHVLRAFPSTRVVEWFAELGVELHEEEDGKLFPDTNHARTVLEALLADAGHRGVTLDSGHRVSTVERASIDSASVDGEGVEGTGDGFVVDTHEGPGYLARAVVLATGGRSLPKTGSDGFGYELARRLGHGHVETTPALAPLVLGGDRHRALTGVSHPAALTLRVNGESTIRLEGSLLWTHFGVSGPAVLDMSRHWHRARLDRTADVDVWLNVCPPETPDSLDRWLLEQERARPRTQLATVLADRLPATVAEAWVGEAGFQRDRTFAHFSRHERQRLVQQLLETPLDVQSSRGYSFAEATAGGVPLDEIDAATMASRVCPGLYLVGEILDVDGRLGGFNFQWAWSSGWVAGHGIAKALDGGRA
jgi:predicted Rossmann fold flavoprotein